MAVAPELPCGRVRVGVRALVGERAVRVAALMHWAVEGRQAEAVTGCDPEGLVEEVGRAGDGKEEATRSW